MVDLVFNCLMMIIHYIFTFLTSSPQGLLTVCVAWDAEGTSHFPPSTPARPGSSVPPPPPPAFPTLVITQVCVISLGLEGSCASAQVHSGMGTGASIVSRRAFINQILKYYISECPEKIGGNALGLEDSILPLECQS